MSEADLRRREQPRPVRHRLATLALPLFLLGSLLHLELVLRARSAAPFVNDGLVHLTLFGAVMTLLVTLVAGLLTGAARTAVVVGWLIALTVLFGSQLVHYDFFSTFYTVFSAVHGGQVTQFLGDILATMWASALWIALLLVPLAAFFVLRRRLTTVPGRYGWTGAGIAAGLMVGCLLLAVVAVDLVDLGAGSARDIYRRSTDPLTSVNRLGLLTTMRLDVQRTVLEFQPEPAPPPVVLPPEPVPVRPSERPDDGAATPTPAPVVEPNVMGIDFEALMAAAASEELAQMHQYFGTREPTMTNEHTGMFEGYNLVFITAEAYSHYAVDPELTPTLYKLTHDGFHFTNFYNPIWGVSTSDGEYVATTGLLPKTGVWSMYASGANAMPFAMGNQLQQLGYATFAYHNHSFDYYRRDVSHPNLGYDYQGLGNGLEVSRTWPASDLEMIDVTTSEYLGDEPFHAYYMTVSGHLRYNFTGNFIAQKNRELVEDLPYTEAGRAYLATQIELDRALELLLERLEEAGVADRTLIVMSADHYPYGLEKDELDDLAGHRVEDNFELHKSSLIIYARGMEPQTVDRPVSSLDIIPTVSNLLGLEFDSRLLMGTDAFSDTPPLVIFNNRSFITDQGRYRSGPREFVPEHGVDVAGDYQQLVSEEIDRRFYYSAMILDEDYYRVVLAE